MSVLYQVECKGCGLEFFVPPAHQGVTLCRSCEALKELLEPRMWEKPAPTIGLKRGLKFALFIVAPLWIAFYFLVLHWK